jgi:hypothetical protein
VNVSTIIVPPEVAEEKIGEYKTLLKTQRRVEDVEMRRMYKAAMKGKPIIDVAAAWKATGLKDTPQGAYPRLALAHANWSECHFSRWDREFRDTSRSMRGREHWIRIPDDVWNWEAAGNRTAKTAVPFMPPSVRPRRWLSTYHILFEVENWIQYPADPFLLKHITGWLFVVEAEWELTELERALLEGLR